MQNIAVFLFVACIAGAQLGKNLQKYRMDPLISDQWGNPLDSTTSFFPDTLWIDGGAFESNESSSESATFHFVNEIVLCNYYLGNERYRFSWIRSFDGAVFITISEKNGSIFLAVKKLSKPFVPGLAARTYLLPEGISADQKADLEKTLAEFRELPSLVINHEKEISKAEWNEFKKLMNEAEYWTMQPTNSPRGTLGGLDGASWTIEAHTQRGYGYVHRWAANGRFRTIGEYLIQLAGLNSEEIY